MSDLFVNKLDSSFKTFLKEDAIVSLPSPGNIEIGLEQSEEIRMLEAINSVLAGLTQTPAINPYYMVQRIKDRVKLATGLTFDDAYFVGEGGTIERALSAVDYIYAHTHDPNARTVIDNGYLNKFPGGLVIKFQFLKVGNLYTVNAEIMKAAEPPKPAKISEKKD